MMKNRLKIIVVLIVSFPCLVSCVSKFPATTSLDGNDVIFSSDKYGGYSFTVANNWQWAKDMNLKQEEVDSYSFEHSNGTDGLVIAIQPILNPRQSFLKKDPARDLEVSTKRQGFKMSSLRTIKIPGAASGADAYLDDVGFVSSLVISSVGSLEYMIALSSKDLSSEERALLIADIIASFTSGIKGS